MWNLGFQARFAKEGVSPESRGRGIVEGGFLYEYATLLGAMRICALLEGP